MLPINVRPLWGLLSDAEYRLFHEYYESSNNPIATLLLEFLSDFERHEEFPDIGRLIIVELRNAKYGHSGATIPDWAGKEHVLQLLDKFFVEKHVIAPTNYQIHSTLPSRLEHLCRVLKHPQDTLPDYLKTKYYPSTYPSSGLNAAAWTIQSAWHKWLSTKNKKSPK